MGEQSEILESSSTVVAKEPTKEILKSQHFDYTLVYGQGPVQESRKVPQSGREGLNFYSRMNALAAAEMLEQGITDKLILSGGKTGARAELEEGKTEAELMYDTIRRHITHLDQDGNAYTVLGKKVTLQKITGERKTTQEIDNEIHELLKDKILIENQAKDTLANFTFILNKYLEQSGMENGQIALLGTDFHKERLSTLSEIFGLGNHVYSAEDIIENLIVEDISKTHGSFVREKLKELSNMSKTHEVTQLKLQQEKILVQGLKGGDWLRVARLLKNPERVKQGILKDTYIMGQFEQAGYSKQSMQQMSGQMLLDLIFLPSQDTDKSPDGKVIVATRGLEEYPEVKARVFVRLKEMSRPDGPDYFGMYAKGELPKK